MLNVVATQLTLENTCPGMTVKGLVSERARGASIGLLHPDNGYALNVPINRIAESGFNSCQLIKEIAQGENPTVILVEDAADRKRFAYDALPCKLCELAGICANRAALLRTGYKPLEMCPIEITGSEYYGEKAPGIIVYEHKGKEGIVTAPDNCPILTPKIMPWPETIAATMTTYQFAKKNYAVFNSALCQSCGIACAHSPRK